MVEQTRSDQFKIKLINIKSFDYIFRTCCDCCRICIILPESRNGNVLQHPEAFSRVRNGFGDCVYHSKVLQKPEGFLHRKSQLFAKFKLVWAQESFLCSSRHLRFKKLTIFLNDFLKLL